MKTYIKPQSDIEKISTDIHILNKRSNPGLNGKGGDGNQLVNQGGYDDDLYDGYEKPGGLWDDGQEDNV